MSKYIRKGIRIRFPNGKAYSREWLDDHPEVRERLLRTHAHERVSCLCKPAGVEMTIRHRNGLHHLANLPNKSHYHSVSCPSYAVDPSTTGLHYYSVGAIASSGDRKHVTIDVRRPSAAPYTHFSYDAFLQLLWDESGLVHWSPKMLGKRNYFTARMALMSAAERLFLCKDLASRQLSQILRLPQKSKDKSKQTSDSAAGESFICGQIYRVFKGPHSVGLVFKYDPKVYWVSEEKWTHSAKQVLGPYAEPVLPEDDRYVFVLAQSTSTAAGNFSIDSLGILPVTRHWIPAFFPEESRLITALIESDRRFIRCLPFDAVSDPAIPIVCLVDTQEPTSIYNPMLSEFPCADQLPEKSAGVALSR